MRKDVECIFGILKGQFSILRYGLCFAKVEEYDKAWIMCCALHNMLLFVDSLHKNWENNLSSEYNTMTTNDHNKNKIIQLHLPYQG